jgi:hypothetical protein
MTAASIAQLIAAGDAAPMPAWRFVALEARADLAQVASYTRGDRGAA